jgi:GATA zinc finger
MCANCGARGSSVWRAGNAGLILCNACGMFYSKHDHEHRPEHLISAARAKAEAAAIAAAAAAADLADPCESPAAHHGCPADSRQLLDFEEGSLRAASCPPYADGRDSAVAGGRGRRRRAPAWLACDGILLPGRPGSAGAPGDNTSYRRPSTPRGRTSGPLHRWGSPARSYSPYHYNKQMPGVWTRGDDNSVAYDDMDWSVCYEGVSDAIQLEDLLSRVLPDGCVCMCVCVCVHAVTTAAISAASGQSVPDVSQAAHAAAIAADGSPPSLRPSDATAENAAATLVAMAGSGNGAWQLCKDTSTAMDIAFTPRPVANATEDSPHIEGIAQAWARVQVMVRDGSDLAQEGGKCSVADDSWTCDGDACSEEQAVMLGSDAAAMANGRNLSRFAPEQRHLPVRLRISS